MHTRLIILLAIAIESPLVPLSSVANEKLPARSEKDYDFGDKVLYIVTKPKDPQGQPGIVLIEKTRVLRLGERAFLVGQIPALGEEPRQKAELVRPSGLPYQRLCRYPSSKPLPRSSNTSRRLKSWSIRLVRND